MTIQFQGHIEDITSAGSSDGRVTVHVVTDHTICPKEIWVAVPKEDVAHWLVGRCVSITMHAFDYKVIVSSASEEGK